ncbi:MAG: purine-binding chemotaxis protein CheW [Firmicutes bacterium]|nr:purine-binding chemotaxis protein CheW [Bacillota bacterium]
MSEKQYVVFVLDGEYYGIDILNIQEITRYEAPTRIPNMPSYMQGIINLRGNIIPVINLRKRFSLGSSEVTGESRIIVVNLFERKAGLLVDAVTQVTKIGDGQIEPPQEITAGCERKYIAGLAKKGEKIIILLEPAAVLAEGQEVKTGKIAG